MGDLLTGSATLMLTDLLPTDGHRRFAPREVSSNRQTPGNTLVRAPTLFQQLA
jgi:hypothetical protein